MRGRSSTTVISSATTLPPALSRQSGWRLGLVPRIVGLVVLAIILTGALISAVSMRQSRVALREQTFANNLASADLAAQFAYRYMEGTRMAIDLLAQRPSIQQAVVRGLFSLATPELQEFLRINNRLDGCSIFDAAGITRATGNLPPSGLGNDSSRREWFRQILSARESYLGVPVVSPATGRPAVPYGVPLFDDDRAIKGIVLCGISLAALTDALANFSTGLSARTSLVERRNGGIILVHPDRRRILQPISGLNLASLKALQGERGVIETENSGGELNLVSFAPVPNLPWSALIHQPSAAVFDPVERAMRDGALYSGAILFLAVAITALLARGVTRPLIHLRDAAGRIAAGDLNQRVSIGRRDEVGDVGRAFDRMAAALAERSAQLQEANEELQSQYRKIQDTNRLKSEFLANMSHELRTPLNAVIGFAQLIHDGKAGPVTPEQQEFLNDILASADHLLQLINDVLDLAKVESGKLEFHPEPVQLSKLITEVKNIVQPLAAGKRLTVEVEVDDGLGEIIIDPAKLKQVLYNYLSNAIKFTLEEGRIAVRARPENGGHFRLEVQDSGIGIPAEDLDRLFVAFQQLDASDAKKHQGTGLGLALTKKIVEAQGGRVGVESQRGSGSLFYAILPTGLPVENSGDDKAGLVAKTPSNAPAVLVVEDSEADTLWLTKILAGAGYLVDSARTGAEAIAKSRRRAYGAILLDLILPDMGGWDALHSIRTVGPNENTPVIIVSVVAEKGVAKGFPIQDYLVKPVHADRLLEALRRRGAANGGDARRPSAAGGSP